MELKEVMNVMQVSGERIPSGYYKKPEVDAVLAELKDHNVQLLSENMELKQKLHDAERKADLAEWANTEYRKGVDKLKAENEILKGREEVQDDYRGHWLALKGENDKLKAKLESVQASMYADVVDANMEVRRLKRALYIVLARSFCCMRELAARNALYDDECKWDNFKTTCLKKAESYL